MKARPNLQIVMMKLYSMEDSFITLFVPGSALEAGENTFPGATIEEKLQTAMRRYLSNHSFIEGYIKTSTPLLFINKHYFDSTEMGYNVIAKIL